MRLLTPVFLIPFLAGLAFVVMGFVGLRNPAKKINPLRGYRTRTAMRSQDHWDFAQLYSSRQLVQWGGLLVFFAPLGIMLPLPTIPATLLGLLTTLVFSTFPILNTEKALKKRFENK